MDKESFKKLYWNYYLELEKDTFQCHRYCEIDELNDNSYSIKYLQLLLHICSEIDVLSKKVCSIVDNNHYFKSEKATINDYKKIFKKYLPTLNDEIVVLKNYRYRDIQPWKGINSNETPFWWKSYNVLKHHRDENNNYTLATQKTLMYSISALYILLEYCCALYYTNNNSGDEMIEFVSKQLQLKQWKCFYSSFIGQDWFEKKDFLKYLKGDESDERV